MHGRFLQTLAEEGTLEAHQAAMSGAGTSGEEGELPCPACGTAAPLADGACTDCGLVLG